MQPNEDRLLTTHVGSLPRSKALLEMLVAINDGEEVDREAFRRQVASDTDAVIRAQLDAGIDVGCDGELPRIGFSFYVKDRMTGFGGTSLRGTLSDFARFPGYSELKLGSSAVVDDEKDLTQTATMYETPAAVAAVEYDPELAAVKEEMELFGEALERTSSHGQFKETFVTAATPGIITTTLIRSEDNPAYPTDREYVMDMARGLKQEYEHIVSQGHTLQLDAPDLAMERQIMFQDRPLSEFLERVELHIEAINLAIADIPKDRVRLHVCWGNYDGPHVDDVELREVLPLLYEANVGALSLPTGNPRHLHDWKVLRDHPVPDDMLLIAGVIDVTTNYVEHPEVVADRLVQFGEVIDPRRLIACTDCGFSTFAGYVMVAEDVAWTKLKALSDGAALASERLF
jgi:5-methyltetrahydropteroyltriglutamate--homocysteine methyltransferase